MSAQTGEFTQGPQGSPNSEYERESPRKPESLHCCVTDKGEARKTEVVPAATLTDACGSRFTEGSEPPPNPIEINQGGQETRLQKRELLPLLISSVYTLNTFASVMG